MKELKLKDVTITLSTLEILWLFQAFEHVIKQPFNNQFIPQQYDLLRKLENIIDEM